MPSAWDLVALGILLLCMCLGDLPWQERLGTLTRSPMVLVAPLLALPVLGGHFRRLGRLEVAFGLYWAVTTVWALVMVGIHILWGGAAEPGGRNLVLRVLLAGGENLVYFFAIVALIHAVAHLDLETLWRVALVAFLLLCLVGAVEVWAPEVLFPLHSDVSAAKVVSRLSLLTSEPSQAFPVLVGFYFFAAVLAAALRKPPWVLVALSVLLLILVPRIQSKGGTPILLAAALPPLFALLRRDRRAGLAVLVIVLLGVAVVAASLALAPGPETDLQANIEEFTSVGTRLVSGVSAVMSLKAFPLGAGYGTYLVHYPPILMRAAEWVGDHVPLMVNLSEVHFMVETGENLSAKTGLQVQVIYNGLLALVFFSWIYLRAWKQSATLAGRPLVAFLARSALMFMLLTTCLAANTNTLYVYLLPFVILDDATRLAEAGA